MLQHVDVFVLTHNSNHTTFWRTLLTEVKSVAFLGRSKDTLVSRIPYCFYDLSNVLLCAVDRRWEVCRLDCFDNVVADPKATFGLLFTRLSCEKLWLLLGFGRVDCTCFRCEARESCESGVWSTQRNYNSTGDKRGQKLLDTVDWNSVEWSIEHSTEAERAYKKVPNPSSIVIQQI